MAWGLGERAQVSCGNSGDPLTWPLSGSAGKAPRDSVVSTRPYAGLRGNRIAAHSPGSVLSSRAHGHSGSRVGTVARRPREDSKPVFMGESAPGPHQGHVCPR